MSFLAFITPKPNSSLSMRKVLPVRSFDLAVDELSASAAIVDGIFSFKIVSQANQVLSWVIDC
jgi:hypothetical protein